MTVDLNQFVGNPEVYATQNADGSYTPMRTPLDASVLNAHEVGALTVGTYVVWYDKARMMVFDIDTHDLAMARALAAECEKLGLRPGIEFSGRKGYHVWVLLDTWMNAGDVQRVAKSIAAAVGFNGEVFPKQAAVRDLGSLVKLPGGLHAVTKQASKFLREPGISPASVVQGVAASLPAPAVAGASAGAGGPLPCVDSIQTNPPGEGQRNVLYFHFAAHLRRMGLHEDQVEAVLRTLWTDADPGELEAVVTNSEFSGPTCDQVPPDRHCGAACIKQRAKGLSVRPGQLRNAQDGDLVVVEVKQETGNTVGVVHPDATAGKAVLRGQGGN